MEYSEDVVSPCVLTHSTLSEERGINVRGKNDFEFFLFFSIAVRLLHRILSKYLSGLTQFSVLFILDGLMIKSLLLLSHICIQLQATNFSLTRIQDSI